MAGRPAIMERRRKVFDLYLSGVRLDEIAKQFGVTIRTIEKDLKALRQEYAKKYKETVPWEKIVIYNSFQDKRIRKLMSMLYDETIRPSVKLRVINELRNEEYLAIKKDQMMGILPTDPETIVNNVTQINNQEGSTINVYKTLLELKKAEESIKNEE